MKALIIAIDGPVGSGKSTVARRVAELLGYTHLDSGAMYRALALKALRKGISLDDAARLEQLARETKIELAANVAATFRLLSSPGSGSPVEIAATEKDSTQRAQRAQRRAEKSREVRQREQASAAEGGSKLPHSKGAASSAPTNRTLVLLDGEDVTAAIRTPEISQATSRISVYEGVRVPLVAQQQQMGASGGVVMEGRDIGTVVFPNAELKIYLDASVEARAQRRLAEHEERGESFTIEEMMEEVRRRDQRDKERAASPLRRAADAVYVDCTAMDAEETSRLIAMLAREREKDSGVRN